MHVKIKGRHSTPSLNSFFKEIVVRNRNSEKKSDIRSAQINTSKYFIGKVRLKLIQYCSFPNAVTTMLSACLDYSQTFKHCMVEL